eukprot:CAMPEP_0203747082 /NCGR_PEP_ID=MMETSP0098-20131031/2336_1 /ASSEMBLY_ACC=CAM_ASM_000208 /TAXON_ID=96639 /ORGANISM=" , Strain NY0313808BC1" /LENGTH=408 /DNA_ID=CAMNT_0050635399 /DNA_START=236 /DNA_END=1462 /DNA_ORIENTATION=-
MDHYPMQHFAVEHHNLSSSGDLRDATVNQQQQQRGNLREFQEEEIDFITAALLTCDNDKSCELGIASLSIEAKEPETNTQKYRTSPIYSMSSPWRADNRFGTGELSNAPSTRDIRQYQTSPDPRTDTETLTPPKETSAESFKRLIKYTFSGGFLGSHSSTPVPTGNNVNFAIPSSQKRMEKKRKSSDPRRDAPQNNSKTLGSRTYSGRTLIRVNSGGLLATSKRKCSVHDMKQEPLMGINEVIQIPEPASSTNKFRVSNLKTFFKKNKKPWQEIEERMILHFVYHFVDKDLKTISQIAQKCDIQRSTRAIDKKLKRLLNFEKWNTRVQADIQSTIQRICKEQEVDLSHSDIARIEAVKRRFGAATYPELIISLQGSPHTTSTHSVQKSSFDSHSSNESHNSSTGSWCD